MFAAIKNSWQIDANIDIMAHSPMHSVSHNDEIMFQSALMFSHYSDNIKSLIKTAFFKEN